MDVGRTVNPSASAQLGSIPRRGIIGIWCNLVACMIWDHVVVGSNPAIPTIAEWTGGGASQAS